MFGQWQAIEDVYARGMPEPVRQPQRKFSTNGAIRYWDSGSLFYVDPGQDNDEALLPSIRAGAYIMFHGPRASGKTTKMFRACEQLGKEYFVMSVTLQLAPAPTEYAFWRAMWGRLRGTWPHLPSPSARDEDIVSDFISIFDMANRAVLFGGKSVVLFIDEFDMIDNNANVRESMLNVLRGLKQGHGQNCLHSVVAIGPFSILQLNSMRSSPFNASDYIHVRMLDRAKVLDMFGQLAAERGAGLPQAEVVRLSQAMASDVHDRCGGHAGLVAWCLKAFDERVVGGTTWVPCPSFEQWERFVAERLGAELRRWPPMARMVESLGGAPGADEATKAKVAAARVLLCGRFLPTPDSVVIGRTDQAFVNYLVAEGALVENADGRFQIRNDIVRTVLFEHVLPLEQHPRPSSPFPCVNGTVDVEKLVRGAVEVFDKALIAQAHIIASKSFRYGKRRVPNEYSYQHQLTAVLHAWVCSGINVGVEVDAGSMRADVLLYGDLLMGSVVLELLASSTPPQILEHVERAKKYAQVLGASQVAVLHFASTWPPPPRKDIVHLPGLLHIFHDRSMTNFDVVE